MQHNVWLRTFDYVKNYQKHLVVLILFTKEFVANK